jgi:Tetratricopeptide repeat
MGGKPLDACRALPDTCVTPRGRLQQCKPETTPETTLICKVFLTNAGRVKEQQRVQAAQVAGLQKLEATLVNNLGTVLRNQRRYKRAVALHARQLREVEQAHGLYSSFLILARHNLVDILVTLHRFDEAQAVLEEQERKLTKLVEVAREAAEAGTVGQVHVGVTAGASPTDST